MLMINSKTIGNECPTYVIAEIGVNYNGSYKLASELVTSAAACGVDAVKIQIITANRSYTPDSDSYSIFKQNELAVEEWIKLVDFAKSLKITIFSTFVNDLDLKYAEILDLPAVKISSTNITNFPLLKSVARLGKPVIMSTGMGYLSEVDEAIRFLEKNGQNKIGILQCTSLYPTPPDQLNLRSIRTIQCAFPKYPVGFSDHTVGNHCAIAAVACGAKIVEKHFTLNKEIEGPDHHFSATPDEMKALVGAIREVEMSLGSTQKRPSPREISLRDEFQRSLVAAVDIRKGQCLEADMLIPKRSPSKGIEPKYVDIICGRIARIDIRKDSPITWDCI